MAKSPSRRRPEKGRKVVLAIVGAAHIHTPGFVQALKRMPQVRVKAVWDHDPARAVKTAYELGATVAATAGQIWSDPEIAGVLICSETNRHRALVLAAAKAGKHLFVEKPLGMNGRESFEMAAAIEKAGLIFTTGYFQRTDPKHLFLRKEIAAGRFGTLTRARASNCHGGSLGRWFDSGWLWMTEPKVAGAGAFGDLGTPKLDILMWLLGDIASATAVIKPVLRNYGDCDEVGEALFTFKSGVIGTLAGSWLDVDNPVSLLVSGTKAHAVIVKDKLYYHNPARGIRGDKPFAKLPPQPLSPLGQFVAAIRGSRVQPLVSAREAAARVAVMEAMYRGARSDSWARVAGQIKRK